MKKRRAKIQVMDKNGEWVDLVTNLEIGEAKSMLAKYIEHYADEFRLKVIK